MVVAIWMNLQSCRFCNLSLTYGNLHGVNKQPIHEGNQIAHISRQWALGPQRGSK